MPQTLAEEGEDGGDDKDEMPTISSRAAAAAGGASSKDQQAASAAAALSGNPLFAQMVQGKLSSLVGRSSGYIESLAPAVQRRVTSLKALQAEHQKIEADFQREIFELEKRFAQKYAPLYDRRRELVLGQSEPTDDEVKRGQEADDADEFVDDDDADDDDVVADAKKQNKPAYADLTPDEIASAPKGVPEFWLTALKNHVGIADLITERDEDILKHLVDIKVEYPSDNKPGFKLVFHFSPEGASDFFADGRSTLDKTYYYQDEIGYEGDFIYDHAVGTEIKWKEGQDPTTRIETKKQRNKSEPTLCGTNTCSLTRDAARRHEPDARRQKGRPDRVVLHLLQPTQAAVRGRRRRGHRRRRRGAPRARLPDRRGPQGARRPARDRLLHRQGAPLRARRDLARVRRRV